MNQPVAVPTKKTHEFRTLHFALGHIRYDGPMELIAAGRRCPLVPHTQESRKALLATLPSHRAGKAKLDSLTHVAVDVPLRRDAIKLMWVRAVRPVAGQKSTTAIPSGTLAAGLHIPPTIRGRCRASLGKRSQFGMGLEDDPGFLHDLFTTDDTATVIIFLHPESVNFDPGSFVRVYNNIVSTGGAGYLGSIIASQGTNWSTSESILNTDGSQWYDANGNPGYMTSFSTDTTAAAVMTIQANLQGIQDIPELEGHNWILNEGLPFLTAGKQETQTLRPGAAAGVEADPVWALQNQATADGLNANNLSAGVTPDGFATLQITLNNTYSRHLSVYAQYQDADGVPILLENLTFPKPDDPDEDARFRKFDGSFCRLIDTVSPQSAFCGIPLEGICPNYEDVVVPIPTPNEGGVASFSLLCGGLGIGGNPFDGNVVTIGAVLTAVFEYAFPVILAAVDYGLPNTLLASLLSSDTGDLILDEAMRLLLNQLPITQLSPSDLYEFCKPVVMYVVTYIIPTYGPMIFAGEAPEVTAEASDPIGWIAAAFSALMTLGTLAGTTAQICESPAVYVNNASYVMTVSVQLLPDANDPMFPAAATSYSITLRFSNGSTTQVFTGSIGPNTKTLDPVSFDNVPAGGTVTVQTTFYSSDGWIAAQGMWSGQCALEGQPQLNVSIQITENQVPLTSSTVYSHASMLEYGSNGSHEWVQTGPPQDTADNLLYGNPNQSVTVLESLSYAVKALSSTESEGLLGYTWQAASPNISQCGQQGNGPSVYLAQVINSTTPPDENLVFSGCGLAAPSSMQFALTNPNDSGFYYVDPRIGTVVRRFNPAKSPYPQNQTGCGRFHPEVAIDDLAVFQDKFMVAINETQAKLQIVHFSANVADDLSPQARLLSGLGSRAGLMNAPVAVAVTGRGVVLVLESGNSRIQAFDEYGNSLSGYFNGSPFLLLDSANTQTFLDMAVESTGFIYVLSQLNPYQGDLVYTDYVLDIYTPEGAHLCKTTGVAAAKLDVDHWRNVWALNYHLLLSPAGTAEPSISLWTPSTP